MKTVEILCEARDLIADPDRWTKGTPARDENGRRVYAFGPAARRWCAVGACMTGKGWDWLPATYALDAVASSEGYSNAIAFNDHRRTTHSDVLALYDRAIILAEQEEAA